MILEAVAVEVEKSANFPQKSFSIGDSGFIISILRNKMYSDKLWAIVKEICSNARDAHREVGKKNLPIQVTLPHMANNYSLMIQDFGPGISPDRMDIFTAYGCSTKRGDNGQTGGFGLGAKTPFAYTDTFTIETVTPENGKFMKRTYVAIAQTEEDCLGKIDMVDSRESTESEQGTKIIIPIKPNDVEDVCRRLLITCRYWNTIDGEVRPAVFGKADWNWKDSEDPFNGTDTIKAGRCLVNIKGGYGTKAIALVDGIQYSIEPSSLSLPDALETILTEMDVRISFKTGEVSVTPNRESLEYDDKTKTAMYNFLMEAKLVIKKNIQEKVESQPNYWEACFFQHRMSKTLRNISGDLTWKGYPICEGWVETPADTLVTCFLYSRSRNRKNGAYSNKLTSSTRKSITVNERTKLFLNDLTEKDARKTMADRMKTALDTNPDTTILVLHVVPGQAFHTPVNDKDKTLGKDFHKVLKDHMEVTLVSTVTPKPKPPKIHGTGVKNERTTIRKYTGSRVYNDAFVNVEADLKGGSGVFVVLTERKVCAYPTDCMLVDVETLTDLNIKNLYGINKRDVPKLGKGWIPLGSILDKKIDSILGKIKNKYNPFQKEWHCSRRFVVEVMKAGKRSKEMTAYVELSKEFEALRKKYDEYADACKITGKTQDAAATNNNKSLEEAYKAVIAKYEMLSYLNTYQSGATFFKVVEKYIRQVDKLSK